MVFTVVQLKDTYIFKILILNQFSFPSFPSQLKIEKAV